MVRGAVAGFASWFRSRWEPNQLDEPTFDLEFGRLGTKLNVHFQFVRLPANYCGNPTPRLIEFCHNYTAKSFDTLIHTEWLRTVVKSNKAFGDVFGLENKGVVGSWEAYLADLEICSNVVPRQAYRKWCTDVMRANCQLQNCAGGFLPITALTGHESPVRSCSNCALLRQLRIETYGPHADLGSEQSLQEIILEKRHIDSKKGPIGSAGNEAQVFRIKLSSGTFAMKQFDLTEQGRDRSSRIKFTKGCDIATSISHPNIVRCFGRCINSTFCALFMELLEEDLESFLSDSNRHPDGSGLPFSFRDSVDVLLQIAEAVKHLHENRFLHGDLKPMNILVSKVPMPHSSVPFYLVKVADFGCMKSIDDPSTHIEEWGIGSQNYTAPEVLRCRPNFNPRGPVPESHLEKIDVYSFAIIAYQVLTGVTHLYVDDKKKSGTGLLSMSLYIYSFGVIAYQVLTGFTHLYPNYGLILSCVYGMQWVYIQGNLSLDERIINGLRPDFDVMKWTSDDEHFELAGYIKGCWAENPEDRPSFSKICEELEWYSIEHQRRGQNDMHIRRYLTRTFQFTVCSIMLLGVIYGLQRYVYNCRDNHLC